MKRRKVGLGRLGLALLALLLTAFGLAQTELPSGYAFEVKAVVQTLPADGESETTIVAFLTGRDGAVLDDEEVRFVIREGRGVLGDREDSAAEADNVGNGLYATTFTAGEVDGTVTVTAIWLTASSSPLPETSLNLDLVSATNLEVRVDDTELIEDENEEATIVAYVLDGLGRPVEDANVTFRIVSGSGDLREISRSDVGGRYAAVFRPDSASDETTIEVALPTNPTQLRERVTIRSSRASSLQVFAFPQKVSAQRSRIGRSGSNRSSSVSSSRADSENQATVLVAVRNGDGELIRGLDPDDLVAEVIAGPGEVSRGEELRIGSGRGSGVYAFTFSATDTTGESIIKVTELRDPDQFTTVSVETVTVSNPGDVESVTMMSFADEPFFANDDDEEVIIIAAAADRRGNAVTDLDPDFLISHGQGRLNRSVREVSGSRGSRGTGLYAVTLETGRAGIDTTTEVRAIFTRDSGDIRSASVEIPLTALAEPDVIVFPPRIPALADAEAVIDIYDFAGRGAGTSQSRDRYRVEVVDGPGLVDRDANNSGSSPDLVSGDNISSARFEIDESFGSEQDVHFVVVDLFARGFPVKNATLQIGQAAIIEVFAIPTFIERGEAIQIIAFATDEFGNPVTDHDLVITVESGSAIVLNSGRMSDSGGRVSDFEDPFSDDGMYVGAIETTADSRLIRVRVTDRTPPSQPSSTLSIETAQPLAQP